MHPPSTLPPARLSLSTRTADYTVMALALILGGGSIVLFAWPGRPVLLPLASSPGAALWWNAALSCVFFVQHSVMVRRSVRTHLAAVIPARYDGAFYAITSAIALALVAVMRQPGGAPLFVLTGLPRLAFTAAALLAVCGFVWGVLALRTFDPFGLRPIRHHLRGVPPDSVPSPPGNSDLVVRGPYRFVRHPLYSCIIVLLWADPEMDAGQLLFAVMWTAWIWIGALLEERDLTAAFGPTYRQYRRQVPMLVPWRGRVAARNDRIARHA
jgi:methanethiol S-methyltransferase